MVVVSFSAAAIEARHAIALGEKRSIDGWISVVGTPDIQSMARSISGGVDFAAGYEQGLRFGIQELLGVAVDIDLISEDASQNGMLFIEDARRDFERIDIPVCWFHGQYDGWVELERVRDVLSHGDSSRRSLTVLPIGHRLDSSRQAIETFQVIAGEAGKMLLGLELKPTATAVRDLKVRRHAERSRLPKSSISLRDFWTDYLVGRDGSLGIELMTACSYYQSLMDDQISMLGLLAGERIADLGCGTGSFAFEMARRNERPPGLEIWGFDYVRDGLVRARNRISQVVPATAFVCTLIESDLDFKAGTASIPVASGSFDAALGSLVLSYLQDPLAFLRDVYRILRPGGRLVVSSLRRDADISQIYLEGMAELQIGVAGGHLPELDTLPLGIVARNFLNDAAKIVELETDGAFQFWDGEELAEIVAEAGFSVHSARPSLGRPSQATIVAATR
ncbi:MAG: class I SAM-dependent methyltransferase [Myxococcales bacterium]|nr:class I SAM-dependent methyltransferase [Myxococcales bacterium]